MKKKKSMAFDLNLDSMLDTLFNVVGMLIIILITLQLNAGEVVEMMQNNAETLQKEEYAANLKDLETLEKERDDLKATLAALSSEANEEKALVGRIRRLKRKRTQFLADIADLERRLAEKKKALAGATADHADEAMAREINTLARRIREEEILLAKLLAEKSESHHILRLPIVRTVRGILQTRHYFCKYGKLYPVDSLAIQRLIAQGFQAVKGKDYQKLKQWMNRRDRGDTHIRCTLEIEGSIGVPVVYLVLTPRKGGGWDLKDFLREESQYARQLNALIPRRHVVRFSVWADSFAVYLDARQKVEAHNIKAGWEPFETDMPYRVVLSPRQRRSLGVAYD